MENLPAIQNEMLSIEDVKKYIAPSATDKELFMFMNICKSYGLNPFKREIHFVKYGNSQANIIAGYEIYLKRAERTNKLDGWNIEILDSGKPSERAIITIYRKDQKYPFKWEVFKKEFDKGQSTWKSMPSFMLRKVAIAQGFRLAFPEDMGGMPYIKEEIDINVDEKPFDITPEPSKQQPPSFDELSIEIEDKEALQEYLKVVANDKHTIDQIKVRAEKNWFKFVEQFNDWLIERTPENQELIKQLNDVPQGIREKAAKKLKMPVMPFGIENKKTLLKQCYEIADETV